MGDAKLLADRRPLTEEVRVEVVLHGADLQGGAQFVGPPMLVPDPGAHRRGGLRPDLPVIGRPHIDPIDNRGGGGGAGKPRGVGQRVDEADTRNEEVAAEIRRYHAGAIGELAADAVAGGEAKP